MSSSLSLLSHQSSARQTGCQTCSMALIWQTDAARPLYNMKSRNPKPLQQSFTKLHGMVPSSRMGGQGALHDRQALPATSGGACP